MHRLFSLLAIGLFLPVCTFAQSSAGGAALGAHFGLSFGGDSDEPIGERLGIQALVPVRGPVEFGLSVARFFDFPDVSNPTVTGSAWLSFFTARVRPFGPGSVLSLGAGFSAGRYHRDDDTESITWWETDAIFVLGVEPPRPRVRPLAELYLAPGGASVHLGLSVRVR